MKLTRASSYALHAIAYMASQKEMYRIVASHHIARARGIPERFLLKVLQPLVTARVLDSVKGPNGGYQMARPLSEISLLNVLEAVDGPMHGTTPGGGESQLNGKLVQICDQTSAHVRRMLAKVKLSDLMKKA